MSSCTRAARQAGVAAITAVVCATTLAPGSAAATAPAPEPAAGGVFATPSISDAAWAAGRARHGRRASAKQALDAYWTTARLRAARPVEESAFYKSAVARYTRSTAAARREGTPAKPERPDGAPLIVPPADATIADDPSRAYNPISQFTGQTNGKVFYTKNGTSFGCSASIVNSEGRNTVWTAGHCVHSGPGGTFHTNWIFIPGYDDDLPNWRPHGTWWPKQLYARPAWINYNDWTEDIGVALMWPSSAGRRIVDQLGGHGLQANISKYVRVEAFGYPVPAPFDGGNLLGCSGSTAPEYTFSSHSAETLWIYCDMTGGSSGGPWLYAYNGSWGYVNGVTSRGSSSKSTSPYFDNTALSAYNDTRYR